jgi:hypothetical protein
MNVSDNEQSAEHLLNAMETHEPAPAYDSYVPMPVPEEPKKKEFSGEVEGLEAAAREVARGREERTAAQVRLQTDDDGVIERTYHRLSDGSKIPLNETISIEKAAEDLSKVRETDLATISPTVGDIQAGIDAARQQYAEAVNPQPTPQVEQQPAIDPQLQAQTEQLGIDPEIAQAIANPKVRAALEAELQQVEQARSQYANAALDAARVSAAAVLAQAPELAQIPSNEIPTALRIMAQTNPQRATQITEALSRTQSLLNASQQARAEQEAITQQRTAAWQKSQDDAYDAATKDDPPEMRAKIAAEAITMLREMGASDAEIQQAWNSPGPLRSAIGQQILRTAAAQRIAQREVALKRDRSPPAPPMRPGTSSGVRGDDGGVAEALARFNANPSPQTGSALLQARRLSRK